MKKIIKYGSDHSFAYISVRETNVLKPFFAELPRFSKLDFIALQHDMIPNAQVRNE